MEYHEGVSEERRTRGKEQGRKRVIWEHSSVAYRRLTPAPQMVDG